MLCRECSHWMSIPKLRVSIVSGLCCSPRCASLFGGSQ